MTKKVVLNLPITKKHIYEATRGQARKCAIARAIVESDPDIFNANVTTDFITIARHSTERVSKYRTPRLARNFVIAFDTARAPKPFTLQLVDDDFVSERPRQMRQAQKLQEREVRRTVAKATGRPIKAVKADDIEVLAAKKGAFASDGFADRPKQQKVIRQYKPRASTTKRAYAKRETAAEVFNRKMQ